MPQIIIPKGATLSELAHQYKTTVSELMRLNPQIKDPDIIFAGAKLTVPAIPKRPAPTPAPPAPTPPPTPAPVPIPPTPTPPPPTPPIEAAEVPPEEGDVRISPITGRREIFTPFGVWEPVTPEVERMRMGRPLPGVPALPPTPVAPTPVDREERIQRIRKEIAEITPKITKLQEQIGILREAREKGLAIDPKKTIEEAPKFLTEWKPPTIDEVDEFPAQKAVKAISTDINAFIGIITQQMVRAREREEQIREEHKTFWERIKEVALTPFRREEYMRKLEEERRIRELQAQRETTLTRLTRLQEEVDKVKAEQREALAASEARLAPMAFIRGEQARINERYQRQLAILGAEMARTMTLHKAQTGEIEEAYRWVDRMAEAASWDKQFEWQQLVTMERIHRDEINELGDEFRDWFGKMIDLAKLSYQEKKETRKFVGEIALENWGAGIDPMIDTPEEAIRKATAWKAKIPIVPERVVIENVLYERDPYTGKWKRALEVKPKDITDWNNAELYIRQNIIAEAITPDTIPIVFAQIRQKTKLSDGDIRALMAMYGMTETIPGTWVYTPIKTPELLEKPGMPTLPPPPPEPKPGVYLPWTKEFWTEVKRELKETFGIEF